MMFSRVREGTHLVTGSLLYSGILTGGSESILGVLGDSEISLQFRVLAVLLRGTQRPSLHSNSPGKIIYYFSLIVTYIKLSLCNIITLPWNSNVIISLFINCYSFTI